MFIRILLLSILATKLVKSEIFTSVQDLSHVFTVERKVVDALSNYLTKTEAKLEKIRSYLRDYENVQAESKILKNLRLTPREREDHYIERLAGNPIHAYQLMKRITVDWKKIRTKDLDSDWKEVEDTFVVGDVFGLSELASEEDLQGAAQALVRLQSMYQLNTTNLVRGNVMGVQTAAELEAQDCLYLGKHSFNLGMYHSSLQWFAQAYNLAGLENNQTISQNQVLLFFDKALTAYENQNNKIELEDHGLRETEKILNPFSLVTTKQFDFKRRELKLGVNISDEDIGHNFDALCRGEQLQSDIQRAALKCFYDRRGSHYFTLMPAKVEQYNRDPEIIVFHDAIREKDIEDLKKFAKHQLTRGMVQGKGGKGKEVSPTRISKVAWMNTEEERTRYRTLNARISHLTGLRANPDDLSAETFQISNYGIGGFYLPHTDFLSTDDLRHEPNEMKSPDLRAGDRIATFMLYLSDVSRGGATAFPKLGVSLFPEKGAAAFWYNLKKSGKGDYRSLHGGCPVVHGSKWVSNKWIREKNQFLSRKCGASQED